MNDPVSGLAALAKSGFLALLAAVAVSVMAVVVGFTVVPLEPGRELRDACRRLAAGLLCSLTLGPVCAAYGIEQMPWLLKLWVQMIGSHSMLAAYLGAAAPFLAATALAGFWIVAGFVAAVQRRQQREQAELAREMRAGLQ